MQAHARQLWATTRCVTRTGQILSATAEIFGRCVHPGSTPLVIGDDRQALGAHKVCRRAPEVCKWTQRFEASSSCHNSICVRTT